MLCDAAAIAVMERWQRWPQPQKCFASGRVCVSRYASPRWLYAGLAWALVVQSFAVTEDVWASDSVRIATDAQGALLGTSSNPVRGQGSASSPAAIRSPTSIGWMYVPGSPHEWFLQFDLSAHVGSEATRVELSVVKCKASAACESQCKAATQCTCATLQGFYDESCGFGNIDASTTHDDLTCWHIPNDWDNTWTGVEWRQTWNPAEGVAELTAGAGSGGADAFPAASVSKVGTITDVGTEGTAIFDVTDIVTSAGEISLTEVSFRFTGTGQETRYYVPAGTSTGYEPKLTITRPTTTTTTTTTITTTTTTTLFAATTTTISTSTTNRSTITSSTTSTTRTTNTSATTNVTTSTTSTATTTTATNTTATTNTTSSTTSTVTTTIATNTTATTNTTSSTTSTTTTTIATNTTATTNTTSSTTSTTTTSTATNTTATTNTTSSTTTTTTTTTATNTTATTNTTSSTTTTTTTTTATNTTATTNTTSSTTSTTTTTTATNTTTTTNTTSSTTSATTTTTATNTTATTNTTTSTTSTITTTTATNTTTTTNTTSSTKSTTTTTTATNTTATTNTTTSTTSTITTSTATNTTTTTNTTTSTTRTTTTSTATNSTATTNGTTYIASTTTTGNTTRTTNTTTTTTTTTFTSATTSTNTSTTTTITTTSTTSANTTTTTNTTSSSTSSTSTSLSTNTSTTTKTTITTTTSANTTTTTNTTSSSTSSITTFTSTNTSMSSTTTTSTATSANTTTSMNSSTSITITSTITTTTITSKTTTTRTTAATTVNITANTTTSTTSGTTTTTTTNVTTTTKTASVITGTSATTTNTTIAAAAFSTATNISTATVTVTAKTTSATATSTNTTTVATTTTATSAIARLAATTNTSVKATTYETANETTMTTTTTTGVTTATVTTTLAVSTLVSSASAGATEIFLESYDGISVGDTIAIGQETRTVVAFGSLILDRPLQFSHGIGAVVRVISKVGNSPTTFQITSSMFLPPSSGQDEGTTEVQAAGFVVNAGLALGILGVCIVFVVRSQCAGITELLKFFHRDKGVAGSNAKKEMLARKLEDVVEDITGNGETSDALERGLGPCNSSEINHDVSSPWKISESRTATLAEDDHAALPNTVEVDKNMFTRKEQETTFVPGIIYLAATSEYEEPNDIDDMTQMRLLRESLGIQDIETNANVDICDTVAESEPELKHDSTALPFQANPAARLEEEDFISHPDPHAEKTNEPTIESNFISEGGGDAESNNQRDLHLHVHLHVNVTSPKANVSELGEDQISIMLAPSEGKRGDLSALLDTHESKSDDVVKLHSLADQTDHVSKPEFAFPQNYVIEDVERCATELPNDETGEQTPPIGTVDHGNAPSETSTRLDASNAWQNNSQWLVPGSSSREEPEDGNGSVNFETESVTLDPDESLRRTSDSFSRTAESFRRTANFETESTLFGPTMSTVFEGDAVEDSRDEVIEQGRTDMEVCKKFEVSEPDAEPENTSPSPDLASQVSSYIEGSQDEGPKKHDVPIARSIDELLTGKKDNGEVLRRNAFAKGIGMPPHPYVMPGMPTGSSSLGVGMRNSRPQRFASPQPPAAVTAPVAPAIRTSFGGGSSSSTSRLPHASFSKPPHDMGSRHAQIVSREHAEGVKLPALTRSDQDLALPSLSKIEDQALRLAQGVQKVRAARQKLKVLDGLPPNAQESNSLPPIADNRTTRQRHREADDVEIDRNIEKQIQRGQQRGQSSRSALDTIENQVERLAQGVERLKTSQSMLSNRSGKSEVPTKPRSQIDNFNGNLF